MSESAINWKAIENFIGFGRPDAPVLFLGMEEGISAGSNLDEDLRARANYGKYEDLLRAQLVLGSPGRFFGEYPKSQRTWRPMCHLMLRRQNVSEIDNTLRCRYQADRLGRDDGETLLSELLPYPNPNTGIWHYAGRFPNRESMIDARVKLLAGEFASADFELVVAYGSANWPQYKRLFAVPEWKTSEGFEVGYRGKSRIILSPHFSTKAFNTEEQLDRFAEIALGAANFRRRPLFR